MGFCLSAACHHADLPRRSAEAKPKNAAPVLTTGTWCLAEMPNDLSVISGQTWRGRFGRSSAVDVTHELQ